MLFKIEQIWVIMRALVALIVFAGLVSCSSYSEQEGDRIADVIDPDLGLTRENFQEALRPKHDFSEEKYKVNVSEPAIPDISDILTVPRAPEALPEKLISLSVTEDVPLKDVLMELSRLADIDVEIDPGITGGIILRVTDKPFSEVIDRVVDLGGLRYYTKEGVMRVERDTPYQINYKVDFLNVVSSNSSTMNIDTSVLGAGDAGGESPSGSTNTIISSTDSNIWEAVEDALNNILSFTESSGNSTSSGGEETSANTLQINQPAGLIAVIATKRQHESVKKYLDEVREQMSAQVLIEAKVVEVTLKEEYKSGVDWGTLTDQTLGLKVSSNFDAGLGATNFLTISGNSGKNLSTAISFTEAFGVSRTLSSPRLHAMNNQQAVMSFAENFVYFEITAEEEDTSTDANPSATTLTVEATPQSVPLGVILTLQPSINLETNEITIHVRPTLSRRTGTVSDPGVDLLVARTDGDTEGISNDVPVIEVRELDSTLKIASGDIMVIGGLMQDVVKNDDKGVPFLNRAPVVGNLFKNKIQSTDTVETIIFIKATIVGDGGVSKEDQNIYKNFMQRDIHPVAF